MKITIELNNEQEKYFHLLKYTLMDIDANNSDVINHALMELLLFEEFTEDQVTNWLVDHHNDEYTVAIRTRDFGKKFRPLEAMEDQEAFIALLQKSVRKNKPTLTRDELIEKHFAKFKEFGLRAASIGSYVESGNISGSFLISLRELMDEYAAQNLQYWKANSKKKLG